VIRLRNLSIENLEIPFKTIFQHSSAERDRSETILVTAETTGGVKGVGEGCPRQYVTGETLISAHDFFNKYISDFYEMGFVEDIEAWVASHENIVDQNPAAFCSVELALLYAMAAESDQSLETLLGTEELSGEFRYTGVLGFSNSEKFRKQLDQYLSFGFEDFKVKVFGEPEIDHENISSLKKCGEDGIRVRFDANNLWNDPDRAITYLTEMDYPIFALEEPLTARAYDSFREVRLVLGTPIVLDESFSKMGDFDSLEGDAKNWIINLRVSKMGGIVRSLAIAERARKLGTKLIIGAQVGETSLLTRAALAIANNHRDHVIAQEGAFGTHLLKWDICDPPIMFGQGGALKASDVCAYPKIRINVLP